VRIYDDWCDLTDRAVRQEIMDAKLRDDIFNVKPIKLNHGLLRSWAERPYTWFTVGRDEDTDLIQIAVRITEGRPNAPHKMEPTDPLHILMLFWPKDIDTAREVITQGIQIVYAKFGRELWGDHLNAAERRRGSPELRAQMEEIEEVSRQIGIFVWEDLDEDVTDPNERGQWWSTNVPFPVPPDPNPPRHPLPPGKRRRRSQ
jgi:hypothetical protein